MSCRGFTALAGLALLAGALRAQGGGGSGGGPPPPPPLVIGNFPVVKVPTGNPQTPEKILLGQALFYEEQLSSDDTMACATCHMPDAGGGDPRAGARHPGVDGRMHTPDDEFGSPGMVAQDRLGNFSDHPFFGVGLQVTPRSSPTVLAAAFFNTQFWDARAGPVFRDLAGNVVLPEFASLESQAVGPIVSSVEMAGAQREWNAVTSKLAHARPLQLATDIPAALAQFIGNHATYEPLFELAFGSAGITRERIGMALASYERTLVPDQTPFDLGTMTPRQQQGFDAFVNRATCRSCHPFHRGLFSDGSLNEISLPDHARNSKIPTLRNVGLRQRYMSSGQFATLEEVVAHYENLVAFVPGPGDRDALVDFLRNALTDPRAANREPPFDRPTLRSERVPSATNLFGQATPGSAGIAPVMLADSPPFLGNPSFQIGLGHAPGSTRAMLLLSPRLAAPGANLAGVPLSVDLASAFHKVFVTSRAGPGHGVATQRMALPTSVSLLGVDFYAQWIVRDPGAATGISATQAAAFELFARP